MALFKNLLISHDIMKFDGDSLVLHCSRNDFVKAPFDGKITKGNATCVLSNGDFQLHISHIMVTCNNENIKAGQIIGTPMVDNKYGQNIAYILIKLYKRNHLEDILTYLKFKDNNSLFIKSQPKEEKKEREDKPIKAEAESVEQFKNTINSAPKKKTSSKKKTKK